MPSRRQKKLGALVQRRRLAGKRRQQRRQPAGRRQQPPEHAEPLRDPRPRAAPSARRSQDPMATPASRNAGHGNSEKLVRPGAGRKYISSAVGQGVQPRRARQRRRQQRNRRRHALPGTARPRAPVGDQRPQRARQHHRQPHDVQDVHLQQRLRKPAAADEQAPAAGTGTRGRRSASRGAGASAATSATVLPRRSRDAAASASATPARNRNAGAREPAEDDRHAIGPAVPLGTARPGVEGVGLDHDQHGDAAQPVEIARAGHG